MEIIPARNLLFIRIDEEQTTLGRIVVPLKHAEPCKIATIIAVGPTAGYDNKLEKNVCDYKPGDKVLINSISGSIVYILSEGYAEDRWRMVSDGEVLAKIKL